MAAETLLCPACMGRFAECRVCNGTAKVKVRYVQLRGDLYEQLKATERVAQENTNGA